MLLMFYIGLPLVKPILPELCVGAENGRFDGWPAADAETVIRHVN